MCIRDRAKRANHIALGHLLVLGREWVDGRRDHPDSGLVHPRRDVLAQGEDVRLAVSQMRTEERPGLISPLVAPLTPDMASPDHPRSRLGEFRRHADRLRIVQENQVAPPNAAAHYADIMAANVVSVM